MSHIDQLVEVIHKKKKVPPTNFWNVYSFGPTDCQKHGKMNCGTSQFHHHEL